MATSSIFRNIVLTTDEEVENFVNALEEAKAKNISVPRNYNNDMSKEDMIKYFGEEK